MSGPKCWDVVTGEFVCDCQILDKLIKGLLADGFLRRAGAAVGGTAPKPRHSRGISETTIAERSAAAAP